ncbi:MAG TPA: protein TolQ [Pseudomonadales bacterium]|nr:protein TolQ [Pseudomonadales bacterium]
MNESLSVWTLISQATIPVQMVMALLVAASVSSWVIIFQRLIVIRAARAELEAFEEAFWSGEDLRAIYREISEREEGAVSPGAERIFVAGFREFTRLTQGRMGDPELVMQGVQRAMRVALMREEERLGRHLPFLATVGSTSPYVGLFGTVWGIMNSFRRLATVSQASLATVAPGISEALIATAIGLFAAIPAVIGYNRFAAGVDGLMNRYDAFADEFASILHRTLAGQTGSAPAGGSHAQQTHSSADRA